MFLTVMANNDGSDIVVEYVINRHPIVSVWVMGKDVGTNLKPSRITE